MGKVIMGKAQDVQVVAARRATLVTSVVALMGAEDSVNERAQRAIEDARVLFGVKPSDTLTLTGRTFDEFKLVLREAASTRDAATAPRESTREQAVRRISARVTRTLDAIRSMAKALNVVLPDTNKDQVQSDSAGAKRERARRGRGRKGGAKRKVSAMEQRVREAQRTGAAKALKAAAGARTIDWKFIKALAVAELKK